jgi:hypothetical protein
VQPCGGIRVLACDRCRVIVTVVCRVFVSRQHALNRKDGLPAAVQKAVGNAPWLPRTYSLQVEVGWSSVWHQRRCTSLHVTACAVLIPQEDLDAFIGDYHRRCISGEDNHWILKPVRSQPTFYPPHSPSRSPPPSPLLSYPLLSSPLLSHLPLSLSPHSCK